MAGGGPSHELGHRHENWSGSLRFRTSRFEKPRDEAELTALVQRAAEKGRVLRPVGSSHSSTPLIETDDTLVSLEHMDQVLAIEGQEAIVQPGAILKDAFKQLRQAGLSPHDMGDISGQTLAGSMATGTHGSGKGLGNLSTMLVGGRLVTGAGQVIEVGGEPELLRALRISLGACGIFTELRIRLQPAYRLRRTEWSANVKDTLAHLETLFDANRKLDFYWYPRSDQVKLRLLNPEEEPPPQLDWAHCVEEAVDWADAAIPKHADITNRFDEMEYAVPAAMGPACFLAVRERILARHRRNVGWRVLYRRVAADDADLSTAYGRDSVEISIHQNASLPYQAFFADIEPIFRAHEGRPHWAKKHSLKAADLALLYPRWDHFGQVRRSLDPQGVFQSAYLRELLGEAS